ncbi:MAG: hypothetical protein PVJ55_05960 [Anaerolineae bacterium]|jgi:hypothetical protein
MPEPISKPVDRDRLSVLLAVLILGNVLFQFIDLPGHVYRLQALGSPLEIHASATLLLMALMVGLACTGTSLVLHDHPLVIEHPERSVAISWILPGILAGLSGYLLSLAPTLPIWLGGLVAFGIVFGLTISAEYAAVHPDAPRYAVARLALNTLAYLLAFMLFVIIYETRTRSLVTATLTLVTATVLAIDLLSVGDVQLRRALPFAGIVGLIIGESTWALNYWLISAWAGGLLLLLIFYVSVNVAHQHLLERLSTSILIEFAAVTVAVLLVILIMGP